MSKSKQPTLAQEVERLWKRNVDLSMERTNAECRAIESKLTAFIWRVLTVVALITGYLIGAAPSCARSVETKEPATVPAATETPK